MSDEVLKETEESINLTIIPKEKFNQFILNHNDINIESVIKIYNDCTITLDEERGLSVNLKQTTEYNDIEDRQQIACRFLKVYSEQLNSNFKITTNMDETETEMVSLIDNLELAYSAECKKLDAEIHNFKKTKQTESFDLLSKHLDMCYNLALIILILTTTKDHRMIYDKVVIYVHALMLLLYTNKNRDCVYNYLVKGMSRIQKIKIAELFDFYNDKEFVKTLKAITYKKEYVFDKLYNDIVNQYNNSLLQRINEVKSKINDSHESKENTDESIVES